jgi:CheY-like chemotaxis protein
MAAFPKARILCTEDDPDTRALVKYVLRGEGYEVITVEHGAEALQLAQSQSFDLFLVDSWLPGMSGDELTQKIREFNSTTPVMFYSGAAQDSDKESARASGAQVIWSSHPALTN